MTTTPLSGTPTSLAFGDYTAQIASIGATLRALTFQGRNLVVPFDLDRVRPASRGVLLAPWPNRVVDGRYSYGGAEYKLPLTEPARGHALHGFVRWEDFASVSRTDTEVTLAAVIEPRLEYPWRVHVETTFALGEDGLTQSVRATHLAGDGPAPFGTGAHPYLVAGSAPLDEWTLELPASEVLEVTPDRLVPVALHPVDAGDADRFDWRTPRELGTVALDHAYTGVIRDRDDAATVRVTDPSGTGVAVTWGPSCPWVQVHTADLPGGPAQPGYRIGLAVEPMTCAPDAFNEDHYSYDTGLISLAPGETATASWRIHAL